MYAAEKKRDGEIEVVCSPDDEGFASALKDGKAVQVYAIGFDWINKFYKEKYPGCGVWYTERNGDGIAMVVPPDTDPERLPSWAMDYRAFEWIDPDKDFGTGIRPAVIRKQIEARKQALDANQKPV